ncbi:hypothetical protein [Gemmata massiliana]|uniref:hypothetical protein n=1 Tax=Gemmata massiliana TaxID=1210884 RepID=UPI0013A70375|nr:hypothetical protein [Gemmata massiliana]
MRVTEYFPYESRLSLKFVRHRLRIVYYLQHFGPYFSESLLSLGNNIHKRIRKELILEEAVIRSPVRIVTFLLSRRTIGKPLRYNNGAPIIFLSSGHLHP